MKPEWLFGSATGPYRYDNNIWSEETATFFSTNLPRRWYGMPLRFCRRVFRCCALSTARPGRFLVLPPEPQDASFGYPSHRVLVCARPEGAKTNRPRATPRGCGTTNPRRPERATQSGRIHHLCRPFRAQVTCRAAHPGRCPGLVCGCPLGAKGRTRHFNACASGWCEELPCRVTGLGKPTGSSAERHLPCP